MIKCDFLPDNITVGVPEGTTISAAAAKAGILLNQPCGGRGSCGRCTVLADGKPVLACKTPVSGGTVRIPDSTRLSGQKILTDIRTYNPAHNRLPRIERVTCVLEPPSALDSASDAERLRAALSEKFGAPADIEAGCLPKLPRRLRENGFTAYPTIIHENGRLCVLSLSEGPLYGIAADIGTTTVAAALCDLETGCVLDTEARPNPQAEYGADVITRIVYTEENPSGMNVLREAILKTLSDCAETLAGRAKIPPSSIPLATIAANTVMSHFLLGIPADYLRREPYVPGASFFPAMRPTELGLPLMPWGRVMILPCAASYVGGDITAGIIAAGLLEMDGVNMLVDVGTNGEMALLGPGFMTACSCSAGPAFEGSGISCGSRAVLGAVDNVYLKDGIKYDVIGGVPPASVCGSGLISLLSVLLETGVIDRAGKFAAPEKSFTLAPGVTITQEDVSNLIRAKAAVFAGMRVLVRQLGMSLSDIDNIYIAGGFGRGVNIANAVNIGMLPPLPAERFHYAGNTSLAGALRVLCDRTADAEETARSITNVELSIGGEFMDEFTKACFLPHTDTEIFKSKKTER